MAYIVPTAADLVALYPKFSAVPSATVTAHIARAASQAVDTSWMEADYAPAVMDYAAHTMALEGLEAQDEVERYARAGVTSIRSASFSASFSDKRVAAASAGGLGATRYGQSYKVALMRNKGGPRVVTSRVDDCGWDPTAIQNNGVRLPWGS